MSGFLVKCITENHACNVIIAHQKSQILKNILPLKIQRYMNAFKRIKASSIRPCYKGPCRVILVLRSLETNSMLKIKSILRELF